MVGLFVEVPEKLSYLRKGAVLAPPGFALFRFPIGEKRTLFAYSES